MADLRDPDALDVDLDRPIQAQRAAHLPPGFHPAKGFAMNSPTRSLSRPIWFATILGTVATGLAGESVGGELPRAEPVLLRDEGPTADQFDRWVFGTQSSGDVQRGLESSLEKKVKESVQLCGLSESQGRKLHLAGRGDISRYFHRVDEGRAVFLQTYKDPAELGEVHRLATRLRTARFESELFGPASLFAKTHRKVMDPAQLGRYEAARLQAWRTKYAAQLDSLVTMEARHLRLDNSQRERFRALLGECPPPRQDSSIPLGVVLLLFLADTPEAKLKAILTEDQSILLERQLTMARRVRAEESDE